MTATITPMPAAIEPPDRPIQVAVYEADNLTHVADLTTDITGSREWLDELLGLGSAQLDMPMYVTAEDLSDVVPNDELALLTRGRVLRFSLDGTDRFAAIIRPRRQTSVTTQGEAGQVRSVMCKGLLSDWDRAVLPPAPGAELFKGGDTRHFGWMSKEADVTDLDEPTVLRAVFASGTPHPDPWIDAFGSVFDASTHRYFILDLEIEEEKSTSTHMAFGDQGQVWLNSVPMGQGDDPPKSSYEQTRHGGAKLPAGVHRFGFDVQGLPGAAEPKFAATCFEINDPTTGQMSGDTILWRTGYITGTTLWPNWKASATAQGPTVKQIIRSVLAQVVTEQGRLGDWAIYGDDDTLDANGNPLDRIGHLPFPTGVTLGTYFLLKLAAAWCDLAVSVTGKTLYVYRWGERGTYATNPDVMPIYSDRRFAPVDGRLANILSLTHEERAA